MQLIDYKHNYSSLLNCRTRKGTTRSNRVASALIYSIISRKTPDLACSKAGYFFGFISIIPKLFCYFCKEINILI
jgi:hypothetical protein